MYTSILKKVLMALSGIFLMVFLVQHLAINLTSLIPDNGYTFNKISHFMGYNPVVQFILQPILMLGVCFHFTMGIFLEYQNRRARKSKYVFHKTRSSWISKNMILSGLVVLAFLALHFYDFWVPEMDYKYIQVLPEDPDRYYEELIHKFENPVRVGLYCLSFIFLSLHLIHGLSSSTQSLGTNNKYSSIINKISYAFGIGIPAGFCFIALFHFFMHFNT